MTEGLTHTHTHMGSNRKQWESRKWENLSNWKEVRGFWWQSQPARWRGVLPDSRNTMDKDIGILKAASDLVWTEIQGERASGSTKCWGWRLVDHGRPHWPLPSRCWESLSILRRVWRSNLTDTECALTHSLTHFWLRGTLCQDLILTLVVQRDTYKAQPPPRVWNEWGWGHGLGGGVSS